MTHVFQNYSAVCWGQQPYLSDANNLACTIIPHLYVVVVTGRIRWEAFAIMMHQTGSPTSNLRRRGLLDLVCRWTTTPPCSYPWPRCSCYLKSSLAQHHQLPLFPSGNDSSSSRSVPTFHNRSTWVIPLTLTSVLTGPCLAKFFDGPFLYWSHPLWLGPCDPRWTLCPFGTLLY